MEPLEALTTEKAAEILRQEIQKGWRVWSFLGPSEDLVEQESSAQEEIRNGAALSGWDRVYRSRIPCPSNETYSAVTRLAHADLSSLVSILSEAKSVFEIFSLTLPSFLDDDLRPARETRDLLFRCLQAPQRHELTSLALFWLLRHLDGIGRQHGGQIDKGSRKREIEETVQGIAAIIKGKPIEERVEWWWQILAFSPRIWPHAAGDQPWLVNALLRVAVDQLSEAASLGKILPAEEKWNRYKRHNRTIAAILPSIASSLPGNPGEARALLDRFFLDVEERLWGPSAEGSRPLIGEDDYYLRSCGLAIALDGAGWWRKKHAECSSRLSPWKKENYENCSFEISWLLLAGCYACTFSYEGKRICEFFSTELLAAAEKQIDVLYGGIHVDAIVELLLIELARVASVLPPPKREGIIRWVFARAYSSDTTSGILKAVGTNLDENLRQEFTKRDKERREFEERLNPPNPKQ